jgi:hypothetical protein
MANAVRQKMPNTAIYLDEAARRIDAAAPDLARKAALADKLVDHIAEQITHIETRVKDGTEMGASIWRLALEDIVRENRQVLTEWEKING